MTTAKSELSDLVREYVRKANEAADKMEAGVPREEAMAPANDALDRLAEGSGELRRLTGRHRKIKREGRQLFPDRYTPLSELSASKRRRFWDLRDRRAHNLDKIREAAMEAAESAGPSPARAARDDREFAEVVAAHEAGHAAWHLLRGRDVDLLTLEAKWGEDGRAEVDGGRCFPAGESRDPAGHFSGYAAERLLGFNPSWEDGAFEGDLERARKAVDGRLDRRRLARKAERKLRPHRKAIREIADELAERGELPGRRARAIWQKHQRRSSSTDAGERTRTRSRHGIEVGGRGERVSNRSPGWRSSRRSDGFAPSRSRRW